MRYNFHTSHNSSCLPPQIAGEATYSHIAQHAIDGLLVVGNSYISTDNLQLGFYPRHKDMTIPVSWLGTQRFQVYQFQRHKQAHVLHCSESGITVACDSAALIFGAKVHLDRSSCLSMTNLNVRCVLMLHHSSGKWKSRNAKMIGYCCLQQLKINCWTLQNRGCWWHSM